MRDKKAVVIGAGIIGCAIAFELQKKGCRVTCVDRHPAVGCGSTTNSCAIVRTCYSTFQGVALAYEGIFYWRDWANYVADGKDSELARYVECGMTQIKAPDEHWKKVLPIYDEIGIEYQLLDGRQGIGGINPAPGLDPADIVAGATFLLGYPLFNAVFYQG